MSAPTIVAIDGPAGVGKTTVARRLAERLGLPVLDTGAMYRAFALYVLDHGLAEDVATLAEAIARLPLEVERRADAVTLDIVLDGEPVGDRIRTQEVSEMTSRLSTQPVVRERMVALQRTCAAVHGAVVEGRDIGTVVFPHTPHKFFLDARPDVRARRRHGDLARKGGTTPELAEVERDLARRDERDRSREAAPLRYDDSYVLIDTSDRDVEAIVDDMMTAMTGR
ncbi:MAG: (d)CMP kinase [Acidobacteriota bacterium]